jgi:hypothetical protein
VGQVINLYVTTKSSTFRVEAFRMGWYQGTGARLVWKSGVERGFDQPACPLDTSINMVACWTWKTSISVPITSYFTPGDYLFKLVAGANAASYIPLTVWDPHSTATYVAINRSLTEQGENSYGGYSFYTGQGNCIIDNTSYPVCNRARVVSFDRPYDTGYGASDFLTNEFPLISLMEKEGLDVTYVTDVTLSTFPNVLANHKVLLSLGHDDSWTYEERQVLQTAQNHGLNAVFFGGDAMERHVRLEPSILGLNRQEVDYRDAAEDPRDATGARDQVTGDTWESPPASWSPISQIGVEYSGTLSPGISVPLVVANASSWVLQGTGLVNGSSLSNVVASSIDHIESSGEPPNVEVLTHSPVPTSDGTFAGKTWNSESYSDMVYFTNPISHAGTIDTGNGIWIGDLSRCTSAAPRCGAPTLIAITNNILRVFGKGPSGITEPSVSNLATITPVGS